MTYTHGSYETETVDNVIHIISPHRLGFNRVLAMIDRQLCPDAEANARLFCAAPEMLLMLNRLEIYLSWLRADPAYVLNIRQIIAKAEGNS